MRIIRSRWHLFFDMFYIGEGETVYDALFDASRPIKRLAAAGEISFWQQLRFLEFMFRLYEVTYKEDGTIASFAPTEAGVPKSPETAGL